MRCMIVDDDIAIREGMAGCINWEELGFEPPMLAENGIAALNLLKRQPVEIILTDILMAKMDGLELIEQLYKANNPAVILIMSCADEFDYVRKAMRMGVSDYLVKHEITPEQLSDKLVSAAKVYSKKRKTSEMEEKMQNTKAWEQRSALLQMLLNARGGGMHGKQADLLQAGNRWRIVSIRQLNGTSSIETMSILKEEFNHPACIFGTSEIILLLDYKTMNASMTVEELHSRFDLLYNRLMNEGIESLITISNSHMHKEIINSALEEIWETLCFNSTKKKERVIFCKNDLKGWKNVLSIQCDLLLKEKPSTLEAFILEMLDHTFWVCNENSTSMAEVASMIYGKLMERAKEAPGLTAMMNAQYPDLYSGFHTMQAGEIKKVLLDLTQQISRRLGSGMPEQICKALRYVNENFANEQLSLDTVSDHIGMSRAYLSQQFKLHVGKPFAEYIIDERMRLAQNLMRSGSYKAYEVSKLVGYSNWRSFCRAYKRNTGHVLSELKVNTKSV